MTSIGDYTFYGCSGLTSMTIPNSVTTIGNYVFQDCTGLTSLTIGNGVISIGMYAFYGCKGLTSLTIPGSVKEIGDYAFDYCSGLTSVTIPNSVTEIGTWAFCNCSSLTSIDIPNSITSIRYGAFAGCSGLTSVTVPNSVTVIEGQAFYDCSGLTSLTIPSSVKEIGLYILYGCPSLADVYCYAEEVPTTDRSAFGDAPISSATLHVPAGSVDAYKTTSPWSEFGTIVALDEEPEVKKCAMPIIAFIGGKLIIRCETEGVKYVCNIGFETDGNNVSLPAKVKISVYATKDGYEPSDTLSYEIDPRVLMGIIGDLNNDGIVNGTDIQEVINIIVNKSEI